MRVVLTEEGLRRHARILAGLQSPPRVLAQTPLPNPRHVPAAIPRVELSPSSTGRYAPKFPTCNYVSVLPARSSSFVLPVAKKPPHFTCREMTPSRSQDLTRRHVKHVVSDYADARTLPATRTQRQQRLLERSYQLGEQLRAAEVEILEKRQREELVQAERLERFRLSFLQRSRDFLAKLRMTNGWKRRKRERISVIHKKEYAERWKNSRVEGLSTPMRRRVKYSAMTSVSSNRGCDRDRSYVVH